MPRSETELAMHRHRHRQSQRARRHRALRRSRLPTGAGEQVAAHCWLLNSTDADAAVAFTSDGIGIGISVAAQRSRVPSFPGRGAGGPRAAGIASWLRASPTCALDSRVRLSTTALLPLSSKKKKHPPPSAQRHRSILQDIVLRESRRGEREGRVTSQDPGCRRCFV